MEIIGIIKKLKTLYTPQGSLSIIQLNKEDLKEVDKNFYIILQQNRMFSFKQKFNNFKDAEEYLQKTFKKMKNKHKKMEGKEK
jgi:hypothetical protein